MKDKIMIRSCGKTVLIVAVIVGILLHAGNVFAADQGNLFAKSAARILEKCMETDEASYEALQEMRDADLDLLLLQEQYPCSGEDYKKIQTAWRDAVRECGEYTGDTNLEALIGTFDYQERNHEITLTGTMTFEERNAEVAFTFEEDGTLKALSAGGEYDSGELLKKAGLNTLIGMGTVFAVLIVMSLVISCFRIIPKLQSRLGKQSEEQQKIDVKKADKNRDETVGAKEEELSGDELTAVITAVLAYDLKKYPDIRSIREKEGE